MKFVFKILFLMLITTKADSALDVFSACDAMDSVIHKIQTPVLFNGDENQNVVMIRVSITPELVRDLLDQEFTHYFNIDPSNNFLYFNEIAQLPEIPFDLVSFDGCQQFLYCKRTKKYVGVNGVLPLQAFLLQRQPAFELIESPAAGNFEELSSLPTYYNPVQPAMNQPFYSLQQVDYVTPELAGGGSALMVNPPSTQPSILPVQQEMPPAAGYQPFYFVPGVAPARSMHQVLPAGGQCHEVVAPSFESTMLPEPFATSEMQLNKYSENACDTSTSQAGYVYPNHSAQASPEINHKEVDSDSVQMLAQKVNKVAENITAIRQDMAALSSHLLSSGRNIITPVSEVQTNLLGDEDDVSGRANITSESQPVVSQGRHQVISASETAPQAKVTAVEAGVSQLTGSGRGESQPCENEGQDTGLEVRERKGSVLNLCLQEHQIFSDASDDAESAKSRETEEGSLADKVADAEIQKDLSGVTFGSEASKSKRYKEQKNARKRKVSEVSKPKRCSEQKNVGKQKDSQAENVQCVENNKSERNKYFDSRVKKYGAAMVIPVLAIIFYSCPCPEALEGVYLAINALLSDCVSNVDNALSSDEAFYASMLSYGFLLIYKYGFKKGHRWLNLALSGSAGLALMSGISRRTVNQGLSLMPETVIQPDCPQMSWLPKDLQVPFYEYIEIFSTDETGMMMPDRMLLPQNLTCSQRKAIQKHTQSIKTHEKKVNAIKICGLHQPTYGYIADSCYEHMGRSLTVFEPRDGRIYGVDVEVEDVISRLADDPLAAQAYNEIVVSDQSNGVQRVVVRPVLHVKKERGKKSKWGLGHVQVPPLCHVEGKCIAPNHWTPLGEPQVNMAFEVYPEPPKGSYIGLDVQQQRGADVGWIPVVKKLRKSELVGKRFFHADAPASGLFRIVVYPGHKGKKGDRGKVDSYICIQNRRGARYPHD